MENFKLELQKKERYYMEIEKENRRLKPYYEKFNQIKSMMEETLEKVSFLRLFQTKYFTFPIRLRERKKKIKNLRLYWKNQTNKWKGL